LRYSCGHVSTKKNVRGIKDATDSMPQELRNSRYIRYSDNICYPQYGETYNIGDNQYSHQKKTCEMITPHGVITQFPANGRLITPKMS